MQLTKVSTKHGQVELHLNEAVTWWKAGRSGISDHKEAKDSRWDTNWRGGTVRDLLDACTGQIDMGPYQSALDALAPVMRSFTAAHASHVVRRSRRMDETDGDWQYDRRWEEKPFMRTIRQAVPSKVIRMDVNMCVSGGVSAADMDAYGATVWAVAQCLERMGRRTEITWIARNGDSNRTRYTVRIPLKKANEYLAPSLLAATLNTNFYRRMGFALCHLACEGNGMRPPEGLGPTYYADPIAYRDGIMTFCPAKAYHFGGEKLQTELTKVLTESAA